MRNAKWTRRSGRSRSAKSPAQAGVWGKSTTSPIRHDEILDRSPAAFFGTGTLRCSSFPRPRSIRRSYPPEVGRMGAKHVSDSQEPPQHQPVPTYSKILSRHSLTTLTISDLGRGMDGAVGGSVAPMNAAQHLKCRWSASGRGQSDMHAPLSAAGKPANPRDHLPILLSSSTGPPRTATGKVVACRSGDCRSDLRQSWGQVPIQPTGRQSPPHKW
jgi:hypothetical protein